ncbi:hypothetical protein K504DRAFT_340476, partial [Pleomassaria siparia CBS 279.74]
RFMVDMPTYLKLHPQPEDSDDEEDLDLIFHQSEDPQITRTQTDPPASGWLLLPPSVMGFDMHDHQWKSLLLANISRVSWKESLFEDVLLPEETKNILRAIVPRSIKMHGSSFDTSSQDGSVDRSSILVFRGAPGTGKASAVEGLAESAQKSIYRLTMAEVGSTALELERAFRFVVSLTQSWDCIILLEDADALFEARRSKNVAQNAMITTFQRLLHQFEGTIILTSVRIDAFDNGFLSHFDHIVQFAPMDVKTREDFW